MQRIETDLTLEAFDRRISNIIETLGRRFGAGLDWENDQIFDTLDPLKGDLAALIEDPRNSGVLRSMENDAYLHLNNIRLSLQALSKLIELSANGTLAMSNWVEGPILLVQRLVDDSFREFTGYMEECRKSPPDLAQQSMRRLTPGQ